MGKIPEKLRIGVIGIGIRGQHSYEQILKRDSRVKIVACSHYPNASKILEEDTDESFRLKYAEQLGAKYYYDDYEQLLARDDIDLISLMCEPERALELGIKCFESGKHILRDKPMTKTANQARKLLEYSEKYNKQLLVALPLRFHSVLNEAKNNIDTGQIGQILAVTMGYIWTNGPLQGFKASKDYINAYGGGDVTNAGFHAIDYLNWIINSEPVSVYCVQGSFFYDDYKKVSMEDFGKLTITYRNGVIANLITGRVPAKREMLSWVDISAENGAIDIRNIRATFKVDNVNLPFDNVPLDAIGKAIVDSILNKDKTDESLSTGRDALKVAAILDAARKSVYSKCEVNIDGTLLE